MRILTSGKGKQMKQIKADYIQMPNGTRMFPIMLTLSAEGYSQDLLIRMVQEMGIQYGAIHSTIETRDGFGKAKVVLFKYWPGSEKDFEEVNEVHDETNGETINKGVSDV